MENPTTPSVPDDQLLRINDVAKLTTLSKSCINLWVAQGRFPKPITLSKTVKLGQFGAYVSGYMNSNSVAKLRCLIPLKN